MDRDRIVNAILTMQQSDDLSNGELISLIINNGSIETLKDILLVMLIEGGFEYGSYI